MSLPSPAAGIIGDIVVVSPADILAGKAPLNCKVQRRKDGSVSLVLSGNESSGAKGYFDGYDLRVMKTPIAASDIKEKIFSAELLSWHRPASQSPMVFVVTEMEIPLSYIVCSRYLGSDPNGMSQVKHVCFSVQQVVDAALESPAKR